MPKAHLLGVVATATVICMASDLCADRIVCPVCGQAFPADTQICPNDGTKLKIVGSRTDKKDKEEPGDAGERDTEEEERAEEIDEEEGGDDEVIKYKRHDHGGNRRRETRPERSSYSDRRSRIVQERRGPEAAAERRKREREAKLRRLLEKKDRQLRSEFERRRVWAWNERKQVSLREIKAREGIVASRMRRLYGLAAPLTSVGFRLAWMGEGDDPGTVGTTEIDLNLIRYRVRAGLSTLLGVRSLVSRSELVFLEHITLGIQWPWRFSPYIVLRGGIGALASERFGENLVYFIKSLGGELGIDCWASRWVAISPSVGFVRYVVDEAYWNSFTTRISIGF